MELEAASVVGEGDVSEGLGVEQPLEHREHVGLVLGPAEAEHLGQRVQPRDVELRQQTYLIPSMAFMMSFLVYCFHFSLWAGT